MPPATFLPHCVVRLFAGHAAFSNHLLDERVAAVVGFGVERAQWRVDEHCWQTLLLADTAERAPCVMMTRIAR
jgi:hypothetical protein